jgi:hypothetical protein
MEEYPEPSDSANAGMPGGLHEMHMLLGKAGGSSRRRDGSEVTHFRTFTSSATGDRPDIEEE